MTQASSGGRRALPCTGRGWTAGLRVTVAAATAVILTVAPRAQEVGIGDSPRRARTGILYADAPPGTSNPVDASVTANEADALWASGHFDEADARYGEALQLDPSNGRAHFGVARSLASWNKLDSALTQARAASALAPADAELASFIGEIYERQFRYDEAVGAYELSLALRQEPQDAAVRAMKVRLLKQFRGRTPRLIENERPSYVAPFRLVGNKILLDGVVDGVSAEFVLDTGADRTVLSSVTAERARLRPVAQADMGGVGSPSAVRLDTAVARTLTIAGMTVRDVPVSIVLRSPTASRGMANTFSPASLGLSVVVDYSARLVTMGRTLPDGPADYRVPMRVHRLPMIRGLVNATQPAYFVVDTGSELVSISSEVARQIDARPPRHIPLEVWGVNGRDFGAYLLPFVNLDFSGLEQRNRSLAVLNLDAPSAILGFQLGGILGHQFLSPFRVTLDLARAELRLEK